MPTNAKEGVLFTSLMCSLMVLGMSAYNLVLHHAFTVAHLVQGFFPGLVVAFALDTLVVGVLAKKIVFRLPINQENKLLLILAISSLMVLGMVTCMSLFGILMEEGFQANIATLYPKTWQMNLLAALPLQLLIVGPISRLVLKNFQKRTAVAE